MATPSDDREDHPATGLAYDPTPPGSPTSTGFLVDSLRRRPIGRMLLSALTALLFVGGLLLFSYPFFTDLYTENLLQDRLDDQFEAITVDSAAEWEAQVSGEQGAALTRLAIPALEVETLVVEGTSADALRAGAGHYPNTPLPGQAGNVAIAGHRTTYGKPFNRVDELQVGDEIWLSTPIGDFRYEVTAPPTEGECTRHEDSAACITHPRDWSIIDQSPDSLLTLTSCHPKGSARERIIIRAELVDSFDYGTYEQRRDAGDLQAAAH